MMKRTSSRFTGAASLALIGAILPALSYAQAEQMLRVGYVQSYGDLLAASDGMFYGGMQNEIFRVTPQGQGSVVSTAFSELFEWNGCYYPSDCGFFNLPTNPLMQGSDGNLYGTTINGGALWEGYFYGTVDQYGTIFQQLPTGLTTFLHYFSGTDGQTPKGSLVQGGTNGSGAYFGVTNTAGQYGAGNIFRISATGSFSILHSFSAVDNAGHNSDGAAPNAGMVVGSDLNFYGTTSKGGAYGAGTIFMVTTQGVLTTLHSFNPTADGGRPMGPLVLAGDGNFYGTASNGGANGEGTIFRIAPDGTFTKLHSFQFTDGMGPASRLLEVDSGTTQNLYGFTPSGGAQNAGTLYSISTAGKFHLLYSFGDSTSGLAGVPNGMTVGEDSNLYGTTSGGSFFEWILQKPIVTIKLSTKKVSPSQDSTLTWSTSSATSCVASGAWQGDEPLTGTQTVSQSAPGVYNYTLTCSGPLGQVSKTATLTVK